MPRPVFSKLQQDQCTARWQIPRLGRVNGGLVAVILTSAALAVGACGSSSEESAPAITDAPAPTQPTISGEVSIQEISLLQGTKVAFVHDGEFVPSAEANAPVIAGRPGLLRVFVKHVGQVPRPVVDGELRVKRPGKDDLVYVDKGKKTLPILLEDRLENTLNFELPAEAITPDASFSLRVTALSTKGEPAVVLTFPPEPAPEVAAQDEASGEEAATEEESAAPVLPIESVPFGAKTGSQTLKVKFVPIAYEAVTGTSLTPDLADLEALRNTLYKMYPVANVDVSVREPLKWSTPVAPDGPGWSALLAGIMQLRRVDKVDRDVYYVGVVTPSPTLAEFCNEGSCILGIAPQADEVTVSMRAALVLGYKSRSAGGTLAQELAHAMGRLHAPCGRPEDIDVEYPYLNGGIGVFGYDLIDKVLVDAEGRARDFMSYCGPVWVSDYTFRGIYERMEVVHDQQKALGSQLALGADRATATEEHPSFEVDANGVLHEGPMIEVISDNRRSSGAVAVRGTRISYEAAGGKVLLEGEARVHALSSTGGKFIVAPKAPAGAARIRVDGVGTATLASAIRRR